MTDLLLMSLVISIHRSHKSVLRMHCLETEILFLN